MWCCCCFTSKCVNDVIQQFSNKLTNANTADKLGTQPNGKNDDNDNGKKDMSKIFLVDDTYIIIISVDYDALKFSHKKATPFSGFCFFIINWNINQNSLNIHYVNLVILHLVPSRSAAYSRRHHTYRTQNIQT